jgi:mannose-6-phosphate isomerase-like protein (cupin superfamily)
MSDIPVTFAIHPFHHIPSRFDRHIQRQLSSLQGYFLDQTAYEAALLEGDTLVYEVYEVQRPEVAGEMLQGVSIIHPGKIGREFFMTKGHFHAVLDTAEVYYCLGGEGYMVMETPEGDAIITRKGLICTPPLGAPFRMHLPSAATRHLFRLSRTVWARLRHDRNARFPQAGAGR